MAGVLIDIDELEESILAKVYEELQRIERADERLGYVKIVKNNALLMYVSAIIVNN